MNPAASGADSNKTREALAKLDWMVNVNIFENETGSFWKGPGMDPKKIKTEVFFLPCAVAIEKEGSISNSGRWMQWRYDGPEAHGRHQAGRRHDLRDFGHEDPQTVPEGKGAFPDPVIRSLNVGFRGSHFDPHKVAKLINGYYLKDTTIKMPDTETVMKGQQVATFAHLQADGRPVPATGSMRLLHGQGQHGRPPRQDPDPDAGKCRHVPQLVLVMAGQPPRHLQPRLRRHEGKPYNPQKAVIAWEDGKWVGDVVDGPWPPMATRGQIPLHHDRDRPGHSMAPA
jgi:formate dehydrogenase major subunit